MDSDAPKLEPFVNRYCKTNPRRDKPSGPNRHPKAYSYCSASAERTYLLDHNRARSLDCKHSTDQFATRQPCDPPDMSPSRATQSPKEDATDITSEPLLELQWPPVKSPDQYLIQVSYARILSTIFTYPHPYHHALSPYHLPPRIIPTLIITSSHLPSSRLYLHDPPTLSFIMFLAILMW